jgi:hypothetical protein
VGGDGELRKKRNSLHDPEGSIEARASLSSLFPLIRPSVNHDQLLSLTRLYVAVKSKESKRDEAKSKTKDGHSLSGIDSELDWVDSKRVQRQKQGKEGEARTSKTGADRSLSGIDGELDWVGSKRAQQQAGSTASRSTARQGDEARQPSNGSEGGAMKSKDKRSKSRRVKEIRKSKQEWEGDENSELGDTVQRS